VPEGTPTNSMNSMNLIELYLSCLKAFLPTQTSPLTEQGGRIGVSNENLTVIQAVS